MAEVTRKEAEEQVRKIIKAYRNRIYELKDDAEKLHPEGGRIVNEYCEDKDDCQILVQEAYQNKEFFKEINNEMLLEYCAICEELNNLLELGVKAEKITKINDNLKTIIHSKNIENKSNFKLPTNYFNNFNKNNLSDLIASNKITHCNEFIQRFLKGLGNKVFNDIMPKKENPTANDLYNFWESNSNMINLNDICEKDFKNNLDVNIQDAAADLANFYANEGYLVIAAASDGGNHVSVVAPQNRNYECFPKLPEIAKRFEGSSGEIPHQGSKSPIVTRDYPVFIQAGTYTGTVPPGWAFSRTMFNNGQVKFYVYKPSE